MIYVIHRKRSGLTVPPHQTYYVGRVGPLGNEYTHLQSDTKAKYRVATVEEAVSEYRNWFWGAVTVPGPARDMFRAILRQYNAYGVIYLSCWCKDELLPGVRDHVCHADVIREAIIYIRMHNFIIPAATELLNASGP